MSIFEPSVSYDKLGVPQLNTGPCKDVNQFIADVHEADEARMLQNGSTSGNDTIFLYLRHMHYTIAVAENAHRSVIHAAGNNKVPLCYIPVGYDTNYETVIPPSPKGVKKVLDNNPDVNAILLTSPTYEGIYPRVNEIAKITRQHGALLVLDAAWDHLPNKMPDGVDIMVKSTHKMEGADQGAAILLWRNENVDESVMGECYASRLSTSPNIRMFATIENSYRMLEYMPQKSIVPANLLSDELRVTLSTINGFDILSEEYLKNQWDDHVDCIDPWKIQVALTDYKCTGYELNTQLQSYSRILSGIIPEKSGPRSLTFISTLRSANFCTKYCDFKDQPICNECTGIAGELKIALEDILKKKYRGPNPHKITPPFMHQHETVTEIDTALYGTRENIPITEAVGRICAEVLVPYPPGYVPIAPGQRIDEHVIDFITKIHGLGGEVMANDINLSTIVVLKED